jgi:hypothetical protein
MSVIINGTDPGSYVSPITTPSPGAPVVANDVQIVAQVIGNQTKHINNVVSDGAYTITCLDVQATTLHGNAGTVAGVSGTGAANGAGVAGQGAGAGPGVAGQAGLTGVGVVGQGGSTSGVGVIGTGGPGSAGVRGTGGSGGAVGVDAIGTSGAHGMTSLGSSAGAGIVATGGASAGTGVKAVGGAGGLGLEVSTGNAAFTGTQPVKTADPGANNYACGTNMAKAWALVDIDTGTITLTDGYNAASLAFNGNNIRLTFARAITNPVVHATLNTAAISSALIVSSTVVQINMYTVTAGAIDSIDLSSGAWILGITVFGRQ